MRLSSGSHMIPPVLPFRRLRVPPKSLILAALALVVLAAVAAGLALSQSRPQVASTTDGPVEAAAQAEQSPDFESRVRDYLLDNPEVIVEAMERLQAREQTAQAERQVDAIRARTDELYGRDDPFMGKADAGFAIVTFFDYQCPYCKRVAEDVVELAEESEDLKIVFKEFPVFGEPSFLAARAALAADRQGKYREFHLAMMELRGAPTQQTVERTAENLGLDLERLRRDMDAPEIDAALAANRALADAIGVTGTPAFIIGDRLIPGAIDKETMRAMIESVRGG